LHAPDPGAIKDVRLRKRRGRINARELWEQMNTCSCLNLILACIVYWQACEISRVLSECDPVANGIHAFSFDQTSLAMP
jgi:TnpA family transposase